MTDKNVKPKTPAERALAKLCTKEYSREFINGFKELAKMTDELINGEYEDEEEVVGTNALDVPCFALHTQAFVKGYESGSCTWISCLDELPDPEEYDRVLVYIEPKASQKNNNITIMAASVMKHHKKEGTHWMPLPKFE